MLKVLKKLRVASHNPKFTGSFKNKCNYHSRITADDRCFALYCKL